MAKSARFSIARYKFFQPNNASRFTFLGHDFKHYSTNTLMGNWFEKRLGTVTDRKAIVPGVTNKTTCLKSLSEYANQFKKYEPKTEIEGYINWRNEGYRNRQNQLSCLNLLRDDQFKSNYTTTNSIFFDMKPRLDTRMGKPSLERLPQIDMLQSYGNYTNYGLREWHHCKNQKERCMPMGSTTYQEEFKNPRSKHQRT